MLIPARCGHLPGALPIPARPGHLPGGERVPRALPIPTRCGHLPGALPIPARPGHLPGGERVPRALPIPTRCGHLPCALPIPARPGHLPGGERVPRAGGAAAVRGLRLLLALAVHGQHLEVVAGAARQRLAAEVVPEQETAQRAVRPQHRVLRVWHVVEVVEQRRPGRVPLNVVKH